MGRPFFSVVIPTYNRARLLPRALDSLINQTERDWEAIVVDDGSTDSTPTVAGSYRRKDIRIRYYRRRHRGAALTKNEGVKRARGCYATFLDSDDEYLPSHLATRRRLLFRRPPVDWLYGGLKIIGYPYVIDARHPNRLIHVKKCVVGGTIFIQPRTFLKLGGYQAKQISEEYALFQTARRHGLKMLKTSFKTYLYHRERPDSLTRAARLTAGRRNRKDT